MPQYSSSQTTNGGLVVNAVLDTESNTITYTVVAPNGVTATSTTSADVGGNATTNVNALRTPLIDQGVPPSVYAGIGNALDSAAEDVKNQNDRAKAASQETGQPVPAAPAPPAPVAAADNPNTNGGVVITPIPVNNENTINYNNSTTSDAYNNDGSLKPGWAVDEFGIVYFTGVSPPVTTPVTTTGYQTESVFNPRQEVQESVFNPRQEVQESVFNPNSNNGNTGALSETRSNATNDDAKSFEKAKDWRVRLSLAPSAKYLYKVEPDKAGILKPLQATNGVIFPYTPSIGVVYAAAYEPSELIHSNYKIYNYKSSSVDTVTITGDFTAQDTNEATYLLAVIHFFKSVTKMFYGQDQNPRNGTPPPLVYMSGMGTFQFDNHPLAVTNFTYNLPNEVDYIRAGSVTTEPGSSTTGQNTVNNTDSAAAARIQASNLGPKNPNFQRAQATINSNATYVPTKMQIVITCIPIVTRNDISNNFSLRDYATGALLQGSKRNGGGIW